MRIIKDICGATNGNARDVENWIARLKLRTAYEPTKRGRARRYTWANTLELAIMVGFVRAGIRPGVASTLAGLKAADVMYEPQNFLVRGDRNDQALFGGDSFTLRGLPPHLRKSDVLIVIQEKQIVERAKVFFDAKSVEVDDYIQVAVPDYEESDFVILSCEEGSDA